MRLGDLDALKKTLEDYDEYRDIIPKEVFDFIDNAPTVEPETSRLALIEDIRKKQMDADKAFLEGYERGKNERPQGEWIKQFGKSYELITDEGTLIGEFTKCPKCLYDKARGSNFCPNCGADMRGES